MLDGDPLAQPGTTLRGLLGGAQLDQQRLVGVDLHAAPAEAGGALGPQRAGLAGAGGELHLVAWGERHRDVVGTGDQVGVEVQGERGLGEPGPVAHRERLAEHLKILVTVADQAAGQIRPVQVQLAEPQPLGLQVSSIWLATSASATLAAVTPTEATSSVSRSHSTWRL